MYSVKKYYDFDTKISNKLGLLIVDNNNLLSTITYGKIV